MSSPTLTRAPKTGSTFTTMLLGTAFFAGVVGTFYYSRFRAHRKDDQSWIHRHGQQNGRAIHDDPGPRPVKTGMYAEQKNSQGSLPLPGNSDNSGSDSATGRVMSAVANRGSGVDGKAPKDPQNQQEPTSQRMSETGSHFYTKATGSLHIPSIDHQMFTQGTITGISLDAANLVALADLKTIAYRTALIGSASILDILFLAPGIHCQQAASEVNQGEYPATGAMTTGYVFRVENQATVSFLQRIGKPGHLMNVTVSGEQAKPYGLFLELLRSAPLSSLLYISGLACTITVIVLLAVIHDGWALGVLGMLMLARLLNVAVIKRRSKMGWKGALEPGVQGDLLIIVSQDRWIRMRGMVDDLKVVTAGQWLREMSTVESFVVSFATLLVYGSAALAGNASTIGSLLMGLLLLVSAGILGLCNAATEELRMFDRTVKVDPHLPQQGYSRRLDMVNGLIAEVGRDDWAVGMGLITSSSTKSTHDTNEKQPGAVIVTDADSKQDHTVLSASGAEMPSLAFTAGPTDTVREVV
ncbi:hypothetical protein PHLGIDRAFT_124289 [Phlebiopsis gigantea 11061_1 CR5-6]|uniref:Uncharacterized protein n=1 Tax=Phlebiopsis gigantea (strain 11061_1 CR5-6) TaxID=745531 RepID=A0A0C3PVY9_PHLG1|nr:hypothetical protein PHLGIDRAFT_124289 [Phlebiopsis gigantea 11061_1 CR5-6]